MADSYSVVRPLLAKHMVHSALKHMDTDKDVVPVPLGFIQLYEGMIKKLGFDGPFTELTTRLKPLLDDYPRERFHGHIDYVEPDSKTKNVDDSNVNDSDAKTDDDSSDGEWFWVSLVPYRIFDAFCNQHIHDWWFRYNLTRGLLEFVSFKPDGNYKEVIPMWDIPPEAIKNIPAWERPISN